MFFSSQQAIFLIQSRGFYVSEKEANEIVEKMDKNKNGRVSFAEVSFLSRFVGLVSECVAELSTFVMILKIIQLSLSENTMLIKFCHYLSDRLLAHTC